MQIIWIDGTPSHNIKVNSVGLMFSLYIWKTQQVQVMKSLYVKTGHIFQIDSKNPQIY